MMSVLTAEIELKSIKKELKTMNKRLNIIEDLVEDVIVRGLPRVKASKKELGEIKNAVTELKRGKSVTLEELRSA
jgi:hypothetical protein